MIGPRSRSWVALGWVLGCAPAESSIELSLGRDELGVIAVRRGGDVELSRVFRGVMSWPVAVESQAWLFKWTESTLTDAFPYFDSLEPAAILTRAREGESCPSGRVTGKTAWVAMPELPVYSLGESGLLGFGRDRAAYVPNCSTAWVLENRCVVPVRNPFREFQVDFGLAVGDVIWLGGAHGELIFAEVRPRF
ncbi:MAG: hypothetical protein HY791_30365 [Deltaproteobacteria bacterium]|nr:hypothetical protein [Deltaproteobacteria bacterium]